MYYNKDLEEVQYFNPKDTSADLFISLFIDSDFFASSNERFDVVVLSHVIGQIEDPVVLLEQMH